MISQVIHLPQPKVIGNVVPIHKGLQKQQEHNRIIMDRLVSPQVDSISMNILYSRTKHRDNLKQNDSGHEVTLQDIYIKCVVCIYCMHTCVSVLYVVCTYIHTHFTLYILIQYACVCVCVYCMYLIQNVIGSW